AQLRRRLRQDAAGLARQLRAQLAAPGAPLRRPLPPHVAVLPQHLRRYLPRPQEPALAAGALAPRGAGRLRGAALTAAATLLAVLFRIIAPGRPFRRPLQSRIP